MTFMKTKFKNSTGLATVAAIFAIAGCTTTSGVQSESDVNTQIDRAEGSIAANAPALNSAKDTTRPSNINVKKGMFLGDVGYQATNGDPLPSRFETDDGISLSIPGSINIEQFAQHIEKITGIRVDYIDLAATPQMGQGDVTGGGEGDDEGEGGDDSAEQEEPSFNGGSGTALASETLSSDAFLHPSERTFKVRHSGKLSALLTNIASRLGSDWVYEAGRIQFLGPQTTTYTIWSLPTSTTTEATVGGSNGTDFGGGQPASVTSSMTLDYWETFQSGMQAIIPNGGASYSVNKASGTIVVTGPQNIQRRVQKFVETENRRLSRQVAVRIDVVAFTQTRKDDKGISLSAILDQASNGFNLGVLSPVNEIVGGTVVNGNITSGQLDGGKGALSTLSSMGKTSVLTTQTVVAANNTPTPYSVSAEQGYLAGTSTVIDDDGETVELTTGVIKSGINTVITPRILSSGDVNIHYTMNVTELTDLVNFEAPDGSSTVQLPSVSRRDFMQVVNIHSGDSIVIGSFDQTTSGAKKSGPFNPEFWGVGGNSGFESENTKILIIMSPVVMETQNAPRRR